ncbi:SLATT domain-containing protein [Flavobacterium sp.]|uniref:SLATT domain-containing protein n=1 Tax=Flavobacterium sp. TaxID=239 RepID=UPI002B4AE704|nr:SLATT domain-containing protein [Flavobacterium sp.]HLP65510.1 SLATT domain-containing protein [Flavobacterium sp.]
MEEQLQLLKEQIEIRIRNIDSRRIYYRKRSFFSFISTSVLAAISTLLLGLNFMNWKEEIRICVLVITSLITVVNTYNSFFNYKELWVANNDALNQFRELNFNIEYFQKGKVEIDDATLTAFKNQYQTILNELNQVWHKSRLDKK